MLDRRSLTLEEVRRLALHAQGLTGERCSDVMQVARLLGCIQFDPLNVVARTQLLVLYSRLGSFDPKDLDEALFTTRDLFHYWAHAASFVLTSDFPLYKRHMKEWPGNNAYGRKIRRWMEDNGRLRRRILTGLRRNGPSLARDFEDPEPKRWRSTGWNEGQVVTRMLEFLWTEGKITIAGRNGLQRIWADASDWFPPETPKRVLPERAQKDLVTERSLRALGAGTVRHVAHHFITLPVVETRASLQGLVERGRAVEVTVEGGRGQWFAHPDALEGLEQTPDTPGDRPAVPLSPFDNLIRDRERTKTLFDLDFTIEIYVPKDKRRYGYYVLPILAGDRIVALMDSKMDRSAGVLTVNSLHAGPGPRANAATLERVGEGIGGLAGWLGAEVVAYGTVPRGWRAPLERATMVAVR